MTDQEINEAVAKRLGWIKTDLTSVGLWKQPGSTDDQGVYLRDLPDFCNRIEAAWEMAEKIEWFCLEKNHDGSGWSVYDMAGTEEATLICESDTAPMAICLAFLKLP